MIKLTTSKLQIKYIITLTFFIDTKTIRGPYDPMKLYMTAMQSYKVHHLKRCSIFTFIFFFILCFKHLSQTIKILIGFHFNKTHIKMYFNTLCKYKF